MTVQSLASLEFFFQSPIFRPIIIPESVVLNIWPRNPPHLRKATFTRTRDYQLRYDLHKLRSSLTAIIILLSLNPVQTGLSDSGWTHLVTRIAIW